MILHDIFSNNLLFDFFIVMVAIIAGLVAAISGFGIGSLLTPLLSLQLGTKIAIAVVSITHFIGTAVRFLALKSNVNKAIFIRFGISSIIGGIFGALLFSKLHTPALTLIFGIILIFAGVMDYSGFLNQFKIGKKVALIGGILSGFLGGLVGNQGGIRTAALLSFNLDRKAFVATATAIGVVVDIIRMPIYFFTDGKQILEAWRYVVLATVGVLIGTWIGMKLLDKIPKTLFRHIVAILIVCLGFLMFYQSFE